MNSNTSSDFLLIENTHDLNDLEDYTSKQIITFDYESHILLQKHKIVHTISDDFSINELDKIESMIYSFVKWYEIQSIKNIVTVCDINLGELFFLEFRSQLVSFLKKFIEISNLVKKYPDSHFFASENISELISIFTKNITKIGTTSRQLSLYESIDIPLKFGSKQSTLRISTETYSKIQNVLNILCQHIFLHKKINQKSSSVLLVNFSTMKTKNFLLQNSNLNFIKYDTIIPAIWNLESLQIIRNSNCIVENEYTLLDKSTTDRIKKNKQLFLSKLEALLSSRDLHTIFSYNQISFWPALKPIFSRLCNKRFSQAAKEIELVNNLFKKYTFSNILLFHESGITEQIVLNFAKKQNIPVCVLQHGLYYDTKEMLEENIFQRIIPKYSDYFVSWGNSFKNYLLSNGIASNRIPVLGSLFFDALFQKTSYENKFSYILLASDPLAFNRLADLTIKQKTIYENVIRQVSRVSSQNNKKLIIKTHPSKNQHEPEIAMEIDSTIEVYHSGDILPLIKSSDLVIVTDLTTVILESMIMQKPVISIKMKEHYGKPEIFNYCTQITLDSLDSWLKSFYDNPDLQNDMISKGNEFLKIYLENRGNASCKLLEFLEENKIIKSN